MADKQPVILKKFGKNLQEARLKKGFTLRQLEIETGIDNGKISKMESGEINITLVTFLKLAKALQIGPNLLLEGLVLKD